MQGTRLDCTLVVLYLDQNWLSATSLPENWSLSQLAQNTTLERRLDE